MDRWAKQIYAAYRGVIFRRRFQAHLIREAVIDLETFSAHLEFKVHDETFTLTASAFYSGNLSIWVSAEKFSYSMHFPRNGESRLRQHALILMKKINNKAVYDVMKT